MNYQTKRLVGILLAALLLLIVPFVAMKFTGEVKWKAFDFAVAGILLLGTGLICELVLRKVKGLVPRLVICATILFALFIIWAELAVGLIGMQFAGS